jgi:hypothetical protein
MRKASYALEYGLHIVERLPHSHINDIGKLVAIGYREDLIYNLGRGKVTLESLLPGHAKEAIHLASNLGGDAQRSPIPLRDVNTLDVLRPIPHGKEELARTVFGVGSCYGSLSPYRCFLLQQSPMAKGDIGHFVKGGDAFVVDPICQLSPCKLRHPDREGKAGKLLG